MENTWQNWKIIYIYIKERKLIISGPHTVHSYFFLFDQITNFYILFNEYMVNLCEHCQTSW